MNTKFASGAAAAVAIALAAGSPASAEDKPQAAKPSAQKSSCGSKNGCAGMDKTNSEGSAGPADAKPADAKRVEPTAGPGH